MIVLNLCIIYEMNASAGFMIVLVALASKMWEGIWERIGNLKGLYIITLK